MCGVGKPLTEIYMRWRGKFQADIRMSGGLFEPGVNKHNPRSIVNQTTSIVCHAS